MTILKHKITINEFKKRIDKYSNIIDILYPIKNIRKWIGRHSDGVESGYGEKFAALILISSYFYDKWYIELQKMEILEYYKKYHKIKNLPIAGCAEMLITTKDNKYVYSYRYGSSNFVSSVFFNILINYLFGYTNIDPKYKNGEYHNLTKEQEKQLKKEYENEYKSWQAWWKIMPDEDRPRTEYKIKIGKLKIIPNENGKKRPPKALRLKMVIKEKK